MPIDPNSMMPGQRWVSDHEPELGLGLVLERDGDLVDLHFPGCDETRRYAIHGAPLRRVRFATGDRVCDVDGRSHVVADAIEQDGMIFYQTDLGGLDEDELSGTMTFSKPEDRLLAMSLDDARTHRLRGEALEWRARIESAKARGFAGARMELLPHQLYIAEEVCARRQPRVLLADEVGLGKTIEACLILHRLMLAGRAGRVLILVPEPLCHQWFVELLRRFNLRFALFDEERCSSINAHQPEANPFLENPWVLAAVDWLAENRLRARQVVAAGWDVLVLDEAHHLEYQSQSWSLARSLASATPGLLMLTATPLHDGIEGHFRRLQLLDPDRYPCLEAFLTDQAGHEALADVLDAIDAGIATAAMLEPWAGKHAAIRSRIDAWLNDPAPDHQADLVARLLDGFGPGRVMFRNTRARLGGFPRRVANVAILKSVEGETEAWDQKMKWIAALHDGADAGEKILVICHERERAEWLAETLHDRAGMTCALFHEGLTLLQRDRNAAYFAEPDGARVLICSEAGSEGRNFQFAKHLVLADLPPDLELLEQRIGRLDRIGRSEAVLVHMPTCRGSMEALRARWIHEGLDGFAQTIPSAGEIEAILGPKLDAMIDPCEAAGNNHHPVGFDAFLEETRSLRMTIATRLARGEERLLARQSNHAMRGAAMCREVSHWDEDESFRSFAVRLFEHLGLRVEDLGSGRWFLRPESLRATGFPEIPEDGMTVTFLRQRALERENEGFMSLDHPMLRAALDIFLGSEQGNAHFGVWTSRGEKRLLLECRFVAETVAPAAWHHERYLPQTPVVVCVDHHGKMPGEAGAIERAQIKAGSPAPLRQEAVRTKVIPAMLAAARAQADARLVELVNQANDRMRKQTGEELDRLRELAMVNPHVTPEELAEVETRQSALAAAFGQASLRLDSLRLIWHTPG